MCLNYLNFLFVEFCFELLVNYDYLVNLDVGSKLRLKYFYDSSLTLCEIVLLLNSFLWEIWNCFTNFYYAVCLKSDMHWFVYNELVYEFWWLYLVYKEWNRFRHHCCAQKERGSEEKDSSEFKWRESVMAGPQQWRCMNCYINPLAYYFL